jgi:hypothetical protein
MPAGYLVVADLPQLTLPTKPACPTFTWTGQDQYKVDRMHEYQQMLCDAGITDADTIKLFSAQLAQEGGTFNGETLGDKNCYVKNRGRLHGGHSSFGLIQYNSWSSDGVSTERFLEFHPEWKDYRCQLRWMVDQVVGRLAKYPAWLAVVDHNCPACARNGHDSPRGYYAREVLPNERKLLSD